MTDYKSIVMKYLLQNNIQYSAIGNNIIRISYNGKNIQNFSIAVIFHEDGSSIISLRCWLGTVTDDISSLIRSVCNELNARYLWFKFFLDNENEITVACDFIFTKETCEIFFNHFINTMSSVVDSAYSAFSSIIS